MKEKERRIENIVFDQDDQGTISRYMRKMSQNTSGRRIQDEIPDRISFLELYDAEKAEDLCCDRRYREYRVLESR